ncbi:MAG: GAF domain-containing sensor histidine kinase [Winogradskyella sp.]|uniref:sensor histidine kinase n=1 Tax=Winogradskyella sp. TaxID=1883156 RepID=UPI0017C4E732|nr:GAF domain-containing sensor histidine kinase [Winogradskyella sp.]
MEAPKDHEREKDRIKELESYSILDTLPEADYDNLTAIAAEICGTEISLISLIDSNRQWFKSNHGLDARQTPREYAFCAHAINSQESVFMVQDSRNDERFHDNPLVTGDPRVIFYAGIPLISENGLPLGTLCVIDHKPKLLSQSQISSLDALAKQVMNILNLRKAQLQLKDSFSKLEEKNEALERFAFVAAHDLKSPLIGISGMSEIFYEEYKSNIDSEGQDMLQLIKESSNKLRSLIDGLLEYSKSEQVLREKKSEIDLPQLKKEILGLFSYDHNVTLNINSDLEKIYTNKTALDQILINLVANAIKYNDKEKIVVEIGVSNSETHYEFYVKDNGPGIPPKDHKKIFEIFNITTNKDRYGNSGNGIGLATVKKIIENSNGTITLESEIEKGTKFIFTIEK